MLYVIVITHFSNNKCFTVCARGWCNDAWSYVMHELQASALQNWERHCIIRVHHLKHALLENVFYCWSCGFRAFRLLPCDHRIWKSSKSKTLDSYRTSRKKAGGRREPKGYLRSVPEESAKATWGESLPEDSVMAARFTDLVRDAKEVLLHAGAIP